MNEQTSEHVSAVAPGGVARLIAHVKAMAPVRTAVVHPCDALSLGGALDARDAGIITPVLVAPPAKLRAVAADFGLDLGDSEIVDVPHSHAAAATAARLAGKGEVQALMKGSLHSDEYLGAILAPEAGLRTERRLTHCYIMQTASYPRPFIITDAAINIAPSLEADRGQITGGLVDGPLAFDNAVSPEAAQVKGIRSAVAGQADVLVVPDLESGNMLAKQLEFLGGAESAGIVMGARVPIVLTSRSDSRTTRLASCAIALMLAERRRAAPP